MPVDISDLACGIKYQLELSFIMYTLFNFMLYYYFRFRESRNIDLRFLALLFLNFMGLLMAGSRNNLFAAIFLIPTLYIIFNQKKILPIITLSSLSVILLSYFTYELVSFFDPNEVGNSVKLGYLPDYAAIFSDLNNDNLCNFKFL